MASRPAIVFLLGLALTAGGCDRQRAAAGQATAAADNAIAPDEMVAAPPPAQGESGKIDRAQHGAKAIGASFHAPGGESVTLASFHGKPVLLNLWATWCAPCVKELPSLDTLAAQLGDRVKVVAVSQDMQPEKVAPFVAARRLHSLKPYTDPEMQLSLGYRVNLPTTILFDADGREVWRVSGAMDWTAPATRKLIDEAL
ncbi:TlpA family protein disulfide reductase [Sphingomonas sp. CL5.1]|uniref:TlpA family protein disulfide reductase n=1 Tax=Sphingomonas sp. CL5.1 TaxID=2653203 RepID=UPI001582643B|nr:TlpA disulfide reductase family protein [Sphingomonas sp. CL5.1]QKR99173.1 TlpA family protein disulfide reductase [Sphingomonas sp. CL5.1]